MARYSEIFHIWRKDLAQTWAKRCIKAGYSATIEPVTDSEGNAYYGGGYNIRVWGEFKHYFEEVHDFRMAVYALQPKRK